MKNSLYRHIALAASAVVVSLLSGCSVSDMADSKVLEQAREYFPAAVVAHPSQGVIRIDTHVGNISEQFAALVMSKMIIDHQTELQFLPLAGYQALAITFDDGQCGWNTQWEGVFVCRSHNQAVHKYSFNGELLP